MATTPTVELRLNGRSLGRQTPTHDFLFTFPAVQWQAGRLEAIGFDAGGKEATRTVLETAGAPVALRLTPHTGPGGMRADGSDLALVDVEVVDAQGRRCPTALNTVRFKLLGPAEWRGGLAQGSAKPVAVNTSAVVSPSGTSTAVAPLLHEDNYILSETLPVEGGVNRVSVRSTTVPGTIRLLAEADGLRPATVVVATTVAVPEVGGLRRFDGDAELPVRLERGPTPAGVSYRVTRTPLTIASATAGANAADAGKSFDDDESTAWTNASVTRTDTDADGYPIRHAQADTRPVAATLADAWITYTLSAPAVPTAMDVKLQSFRLRRYPLRVTLDGQTVWEGLTPTSLGYVTLPLKAARPGTQLRVELTGLPEDVTETHPLVEVSGTVDQAEAKGKPAAPVLGVLEAEVYAAP